MNPEECSSQPFRSGSLKSRNFLILLSNATCRMSAAIRRKTPSIYYMVCRFEQVVSCEVQYTDVTPTLEINVNTLNMLSDALYVKRLNVNFERV
jgi:hypothetical protein